MSRRGSRSPFEAIRTEGGLLPHDLLQRIAARDPKLPGMQDADYGLLEHEREGEVVNRAWTDLRAAWLGFRTALEKEPATSAATTATRERWLLPLFKALDFGRLTGRKQAFDLDGRAYPISHEHEATHTAIHLLGARVGLDVKTQAVQGAAKATPHGLVQDFLNRSSAHDWAIVTNGLVLRLLRDSKSITRQAYVEFDLEEILDDERYSEFRVLWLVCHESRFRREGESTCLLEQWFERGKEEGVRALDRLRGGVEEAIRVLGRGFLRHRDNAALRDALGDGRLDAQEYYRQLLRLVYRLIFIFVTEDRGVLLDPAAPAAARDRYTRYYATSQLRSLATRRRGGPHGDQWTRLKLIMDRLYGGCPELGLPALGSFLWKPEAVGHLGQSALANEDLLSALRMLVEVSDGRVVMPVAWAQVGADELGSVYESLLELHPRIEREAGSFELGTAAGHERKTTGSYYTPTSLVESLLDSALDPVLDTKGRSTNPEAAILEMRVCDPACGSGHFLVAAARRIAKRLAAVRSGDDEPSPESFRHALRDVVGRSIFGVDVNPMAVELCKVSLWLEAVEPGRPLTFLDAHVRVGNSLLGAAPALIAKGVPDEAFDPIEGDDKVVAKRLRKLNRDERRQRSLAFGQGGVSERFGLLAERIERIERETDASLDGIERKARLFDELHASEELRRATLLADAWCAAFVWPKVEGELERFAVTHDVLARLAAGEQLPGTQATIQRLAQAHCFFHWQLAFPQVFDVPAGGLKPENVSAGWSGGFDVVVGNPPWEKLQVEEKHFFSTYVPEIASAPARERKRLIAEVEHSRPEVWRRYTEALRGAAAESQFCAASEVYPLSGRGNLSTHALFLERSLSLRDLNGYVALVVPSGLVTQQSQSPMFEFLMSNGLLRAVLDFENREGLFPAVDSRMRFCLTVVGPARPGEPCEFAFFLGEPRQRESADRIVGLNYPQLKAMSPVTFTCPTFRQRRDALILEAMARRGVALGSEDAWGWQSWQMFNETHEADKLQDWNDATIGSAVDRLYEAKLIHQFDHRFATYADGSVVPAEDHGHGDPTFLARPRYGVAAEIWRSRAASRGAAGWVLGFRRITNATNERTSIFSVLPRCAAGSQTPLALTSQPPKLTACLLACLNSFALDFVARLRVGGTDLNHFILHQFVVPFPATFQAESPPIGSAVDWVVPRVLELVFTAWDLLPFARDCGYDGAPFRWDPKRRSLLRAELDAAFFRLYGLSREDVGYILDTFPIVRRNDEATHGDFRTKRLILDAFDRMAEASRTGTPYRTMLEPAPADAGLAHATPAPDWLVAAAAHSPSSRPAEAATSNSRRRGRKGSAGGTA